MSSLLQLFLSEGVLLDQVLPAGARVPRARCPTGSIPGSVPSPCSGLPGSGSPLAGRVLLVGGQLLLSVVLDEAGGRRLGQLLKLLLPVVVAAQVRHVGGVLRQLDGVPPADKVEAPDLLFLPGQAKGIKNLSLHFLKVQDSEGVIQQAHFHFVVAGGVGGHRGRGVDFNQPGLQVGIEQNVETVQLKAVLVVYDGLLDGLKAADDELLDLGEGIGHFLLAILGHQEKLHASEVPLAAETLIVIF